MGMLKKAANLRQGYGRQASGSMPAVAASRRQVALLPCSRTGSALRVSIWLRPFLRLCSGQGWTDFFEHSLSLMLAVFPGAFMGFGHEIFNRPLIKLLGRNDPDTSNRVFTEPLLGSDSRQRYPSPLVLRVQGNPTHLLLLKGGSKCLYFDRS